MYDRKSYLYCACILLGLLPGSIQAQDLIAPARSGDLEALRAELSEEQNIGPDLLAVPLYFAAQRGHEDVVAYLLERGADPNEPTKFGSALQIAARGNHLGIMTRLIDAGADPNMKGGEDSRTPLHDAAERGQVEAAKLLLDHGADINSRTKNDHPPIHLAVVKERGETVALLSENGAAARQVEPIGPGALQNADLEAGRAEAEICGGCHATEAGKASPGRYPAPNLAGILGRAKASETDFPYTDALKAQSGEWTADEINQFIADPTGAIPGTSMGHAGIADQASRVAIIAYLGTLKSE